MRERKDLCFYNYILFEVEVRGSYRRNEEACRDLIDCGWPLIVCQIMYWRDWLLVSIRSFGLDGIK